MDWVVDDLLDGVRLGNVHFYLDRVVDLLLDRVRSRHMDLDGHMDFLGDWVRFGHVHLNGHWSIHMDMDGHMDLLLHRVWGWDVHGHFNDFLHRVVDDLLNGIRRGNMHLDWIRHALLDGIVYVLLHRIWYGDLLDDSHSLDVLVMVAVVVQIVSAQTVRTVARTVQMFTTQTSVVEGNVLGMTAKIMAAQRQFMSATVVTIALAEYASFVLLLRLGGCGHDSVRFLFVSGHSVDCVGSLLLLGIAHGQQSQYRN